MIDVTDQRGPVPTQRDFTSLVEGLREKAAKVGWLRTFTELTYGARETMGMLYQIMVNMMASLGTKLPMELRVIDAPDGRESRFEFWSGEVLAGAMTLNFPGGDTPVGEPYRLGAKLWIEPGVVQSYMKIEPWLTEAERASLVVPPEQAPS